MSTLTLKERDRRWKAIRDMMKKHKLECLILPGVAPRAMIDYPGYVSNAMGTVIFPIEGEPTCFYGGYNAAMRLRERLRVGEEMWIRDWRDGAELGLAIASRVKDLGYANGRIGVTGLDGGVHGVGNAFEGLVPYKTWTSVLKGLPKAKFEDVTDRMVEILQVRTPEELELVERAAEIGEHAMEVMLSITKPGVTDREMRDKTNDAIYFIHGAPRPTTGIIEGCSRGGVKNGDVVNTEWFITVGGMQAVLQMCMAVGKVSKKTEKDAEIAEASQKKGLEVLRPGVKFGAVIEAMEEVVAGAGAWHWYPLLVSRNPQILRGGEGTWPRGATWEIPAPEVGHPSLAVLGSEVIVQSGMTFSFEPSASTGDFALPFSYVKVGGQAIVTDTGTRMLNTLGTKLQRV